MTSAARVGQADEALERAVIADGEAWAVACADALRLEGRQVAGGWPGTRTEARTRVTECLAALPQSPILTPVELEALARIAYAVARRTWLAGSRPDSDDENRRRDRRRGRRRRRRHWRARRALAARAARERPAYAEPSGASRNGVIASSTASGRSTCAKCDASSSHTNDAPGTSACSRGPTDGGTIGSRRA